MKKNLSLYISLYIVGGIVVFLLIIFLVGGWMTYNGMVRAQEEANNAWANVQASYQRRIDLIPNLVNTVKGYSAHESQTLENVTNARAGISQLGDSLLLLRDNLNTFRPSAGIDNGTLERMDQLTRGMNVYVNAVTEAYPDLKASTNFLDLQTQLESTENRINTERNIFNQAVRDYNIKIRTFPNNIYAGFFGFQPMNAFEAASDAQNAPTVSF